MVSGLDIGILGRLGYKRAQEGDFMAFGCMYMDTQISLEENVLIAETTWSVCIRALSRYLYEFMCFVKVLAYPRQMPL